MALGSYCGVLLGVAMLLLCADAAYVVAMRLCPTAPGSVRCCATVLVAGWLQVAVFELLISLHAFRLGPALAVWLALAVAANLFLSDPRNSPLRQAREDWRQLCEWLQAMRTGRWRLLPALAAMVFLAVIFRALVAPPLGYDALTYQYVKPALWVQGGAIFSEPAPDAWSYYAYFPYSGNIPWAWAMLPVHGELLLAPMEMLIWLAILLATYTNARLLGAEVRVAVLAALSVGLTPAAFAFLTSGYVDNTVLATFLLGTVFVIRILGACASREAVLVAAGFGLAAGAKLTGVAMLGLAGLLVGAYLARRASWREWLGIMGAASVVAVVTIMPYLRNWAETGSPLYPQGLRLLGREVCAGNEQFRAVLTGTICKFTAPPEPWRLLYTTFMPRAQCIGFGPVAPLLILFGLVGLGRLLRRPDKGWAAVFMLLCSAVAIWMVFSPDAWGARVYWPDACARFLMPAMACCTIWAAAGTLAPQWLWEAAVGFGLIWAVPRGLSRADLAAVGAALAGVLVVLGAAALGWWLVGRRAPRAVVALLIASTAIVPLAAVRDAYRYAIYRAADQRRSWVTHRLNSNYTSSWPIWEFFDTMPGHRIAVTAGWEEAGHNWYRYPLLGSRLQNQTLYVPITRDGSIINYRNLDQSADRADFRAWLDRLIDQQVEFVVAMAPDNTLESQWMRQHPELFEPVVESLNGKSRAYRVRRSAT